jgi:hypothetical protein
MSTYVEGIMPLPVSLHDVVEEMDMLGGEIGIRSFLNRRTGEIYGGTPDQISAAEESDDAEEFPDWEAEVIRRLQEVLDSPDWLELPERDSREDYRIMERFCLERCEGFLQDELLSAITGRGAFRRFKDALHRHGIQEAWYAFRRQELAVEARAWLEANDIAFKE